MSIMRIENSQEEAQQDNGCYALHEIEFNVFMELI